MQRERLTWMRLAALSVDGLVLAALWLALAWVRPALNEWLPMPWLSAVDPRDQAPLVAVVVPIWLFVLQAREHYRDLRSTPETLQRTATSAVLAMGLLLTILFFLDVNFVSRLVTLGYAGMTIPALMLARSLTLSLVQAFPSLSDRHRVLLVGDPAEMAKYLEVLDRQRELGMIPVGWLGPETSTSAAPRLPWLGEVDQVEQVLVDQPVDEVHISVRDTSMLELERVAAVCETLGVELSMDANFLGLTTAQVAMDDLKGWSVLRFSSVPTRGLELVFKRTLDFVGAGLGILALSPLFAFVAIAIKIDDPGPVFFVQERSGLYARKFPMYKFRTMVVDAEARLAELQAQNEMGGPVFKMQHDPRITALGRFLRRTSIDELPQLFNVFLGQMSLVGPRPPIPSEVAQYERWQRRRLSMKPGITCIWQVSGRNNIDFDQWMELDLEYIDSWSLWLDVKLLLKTLPAVLKGTGAS